MQSKLCAHCSAQGRKACSACKGVHYCSRECQKAAWPTHRSRCSPEEFRLTLQTLPLPCPLCQGRLGLSFALSFGQQTLRSLTSRMGHCSKCFTAADNRAKRHAYADDQVIPLTGSTVGDAVKPLLHHLQALVHQQGVRFRLSAFRREDPSPRGSYVIELHDFVIRQTGQEQVEVVFRGCEPVALDYVETINTLRHLLAWVQQFYLDDSSIQTLRVPRAFRSFLQWSTGEGEGGGGEGGGGAPSTIRPAESPLSSRFPPLRDPRLFIDADDHFGAAGALFHDGPHTEAAQGVAVAWENTRRVSQGDASLICTSSSEVTGMYEALLMEAAPIYHAWRADGSSSVSLHPPTASPPPPLLHPPPLPLRWQLAMHWAAKVYDGLARREGGGPEAVAVQRVRMELRRRRAGGEERGEEGKRRGGREEDDGVAATILRQLLRLAGLEADETLFLSPPSPLLLPSPLPYRLALVGVVEDARGKRVEGEDLGRWTGPCITAAFEAVRRQVQPLLALELLQHLGSGSGVELLDELQASLSIRTLTIRLGGLPELLVRNYQHGLDGLHAQVSATTSFFSTMAKHLLRKPADLSLNGSADTIMRLQALLQQVESLAAAEGAEEDGVEGKGWKEERQAVPFCETDLLLQLARQTPSPSQLGRFSYDSISSDRRLEATAIQANCRAGECLLPPWPRPALLARLREDRATLETALTELETLILARRLWQQHVYGHEAGTEPAMATVAGLLTTLGWQRRAKAVRGLARYGKEELLCLRRELLAAPPSSVLPVLVAVQRVFAHLPLLPDDHHLFLTPPPTPTSLQRAAALCLDCPTATWTQAEHERMQAPLSLRQILTALQQPLSNVDLVTSSPSSPATWTLEEEGEAYSPSSSSSPATSSFGIGLRWKQGNEEVDAPQRQRCRELLLQRGVDARLYTSRGPRFLPAIASLLLRNNSVLTSTDLDLKRRLVGHEAESKGAELQPCKDWPLLPRGFWAAAALAPLSGSGLTLAELTRHIDVAILTGQVPPETPLGHVPHLPDDGAAVLAMHKRLGWLDPTVYGADLARSLGVRVEGQPVVTSALTAAFSPGSLARQLRSFQTTWLAEHRHWRYEPNFSDNGYRTHPLVPTPAGVFGLLLGRKHHLAARPLLGHRPHVWRLVGGGEVQGFACDTRSWSPRERGAVAKCLVGLLDKVGKGDLFEVACTDLTMAEWGMYVPCGGEEGGGAAGGEGEEEELRRNAVALRGIFGCREPCQCATTCDILEEGEEMTGEELAVYLELMVGGRLRRPRLPTLRGSS